MRRHRVSPLASPMTGSSGAQYSATPELELAGCDYRITRLRG
jgi:hypothetical protein